MKKFLTLIAIASMLVTTDSNCVNKGYYGSFLENNIVTDGTSGELYIKNKSNETITLQQEYKGKTGESINLEPGQTTQQSFTTEFFGSEKYTIKCSTKDGQQVKCNDYTDLLLSCPSSICVKTDSLNMD